MMLLYGLSSMPGPEKMQAIAEPWAPYRTIGAMCMWQWPTDGAGRIRKSPRKREREGERGGEEGDAEVRRGELVRPRGSDRGRFARAWSGCDARGALVNVAGDKIFSLLWWLSSRSSSRRALSRHRHAAIWRAQTRASGVRGRDDDDVDDDDDRFTVATRDGARVRSARTREDASEPGRAGVGDEVLLDAVVDHAIWAPSRRPPRVPPRRARGGTGASRGGGDGC